VTPADLGRLPSFYFMEPRSEGAATGKEFRNTRSPASAGGRFTSCGSRHATRSGSLTRRRDRGATLSGRRGGLASSENDQLALIVTRRDEDLAVAEVDVHFAADAEGSRDVDARFD